MADAWTMTGEAAAPERGAGPVTLVEGSSFCLSGRAGDIRPDLPEGLFFLDTRLLSHWQLRVNGLRPEPLAVTPDGPHAATFVSRIRPHLGEPAGSLLVVRRRYVGRGMREDLTIRNYGPSSMPCAIVLLCDVDFADLFDVKVGDVVGGAAGTRRTGGSMAEFRTMVGMSDRTVRLSFSETPTWESDSAVWHVAIPPRGSWSCCAQLTVAVGGEPIAPRHNCGEPPTAAVPARRFFHWREAVPRVDTDDMALSQAVSRAVDDLGSLRIFDPDHPDKPVIAAGAPWFMTLFGRDSLLTAWMALIVDLDLASGVMEALARLQGTTVDPATEEQPGRILHEVRFGDAMSMSLGDGHIYYGTADATALFVMLLGELSRWGCDRDLVDRLLPHADRALEWIEQYGDRDGDGYVEYERMSDHGLRNQGWKDSWDGIVTSDGRMPATPIALCEVQAYVYGAYSARMQLARERGDLLTETRYATRAEDLRRAFERDFWLPERGWYALGLDADKRPIDALASNMGHCLWTGIVDPVRAREVAARLLSPEMFSGWGVRTLATSMATYNPLSYHNGSVWPHDNAIIAAGLERYGLVDEAHRVITAMLGAAATAGGRLPELFAGIGRDDIGIPVAYPASCSPQAWAAAAPLMFLRTLLRLHPDVGQGRVGCSPTLPPSITRLHVEGIPLAGRRVTIRVDGTDWELEGWDGPVVGRGELASHAGPAASASDR